MVASELSSQVTSSAGAPADAEPPASADALKRALRALKDMRGRVARAEDAAHEPIAIVGIGCRIPGADDPTELWKLLRDGVDAVGEVPPERWDAEDYYDPDPSVPGKMVTRAGGFLHDVEQFDPQFFGITPREASTMDPQQRLLIEVAWEALESAGIAPSSLAGSLTATFIGMTPGDYGPMGIERVEQGALEIDAYVGTGNAMSVAAGRLAYALGLHGPNLALDTACSSSLVAVHLAVQSLRRREADAAIAGGVNLVLRPFLSVYMSQAGALSPTGRCHTFDASADGYVRSEGCGIVVLKRLSDALADGDNVVAVIHGSAVNHDGRSGGLTVPNGHAQQAVIRAALADARLEPDDVSYVEAHGTGTPLGDPIEIRALDAVYGASRDEPLWVGSIKTNVGHLEAAAGIAGVLKLALSLQHGTIPPHLHFDAPSPHIDWEHVSVRVPDAAVEWSTGDRPRIAGLSSFGLSGTNCHLLIGEPPATEPADAESADEVGDHVVTLSARSASSLGELAGDVARALTEESAPSLPDAAFTLATGRNEFAHRLAIVASNVDDAAAHLLGFAAGERTPAHVVGDTSSLPTPKVAFLFSGQGAQYVDMGRELYATNEVVRATIDECDELFRPHLGDSLRALIHPADGIDSPIDHTSCTQPALFTIELALARMWAAWGVRPDMMLGHSIGGLVAAHLAGVMSLDDAVTLVAARGRLMGDLPGGGSMAAVFAEESTVASAIETHQHLAIAAVNGPDNIVISGPDGDVASAVAAFTRSGIETRPLTTSHAFHSPLMDPVLPDFEAVAGRVELHPPTRGRLVSDRTGAVADETVATAQHWVRHVRDAVRFADGVETLHDAGCNVFVEIGPSPTLVVMGQRCLPDAGALWLPSLHQGRPEERRVLTTLAELWSNGVGVDWGAVEPARRRRRVPLPTTRFQRSRYWLPDPVDDGLTAASGGRPLLGRRAPSATDDVRFDAVIAAQRPPFLADRRVHGRVTLDGAAHLETLLAVGAELWGDDVPLVVDRLTVHDEPDLADEPMRLETVVTAHGRAGAAVSIHARGAGGGRWDHLADGVVGLVPTPATPARVEVDDLTAGLEATPVDELLDGWSAAGHTIGDRYRCVAELWRSAERTVARVVLPHGADRFALYPPLISVCSALAHTDGSLRRVEQISGLRTYSPTAPAWCELSATSASTVALRAFDATGLLVAEIDEVRLASIAPDQLPPRTTWCYDIDWRPLDVPAGGELDDTSIAAASSTWTIVAPTGELASALGTVVDLDADVELIEEVELDDEAALRALVARRIERAPDEAGGVFVYLAADAADEGGDPAATARQRARRLLALVRAVSEASWQAKVVTPPRIWLATRAAMPLDGSGASPESTALWGMMKTVAAELPAFYGGIVDLDPRTASADDEAVVLARAIATPGGETWLAARDGRLHVARAHPAPPAPAPVPTSFRPDGTYFVTGGFGALGAATASWLVEHGARRLIVAGRSPVPPRATWPDLAEDDPAAARVEVVRSLEAAGATVHCAAIDVADRDSLERFLDDFRAAGWPPIRGVFHAAGVLRDRSISQMEASDLDTVFHAKVRGAWNLHELLRDDPLDHFVMFSSAAAALGSPGQANYAAANAFLDGLAHRRRADGSAALSVNWGAWSAGMAADEELERRRERRGVQPIPVHAGLATLSDLIGADVTQSLVMPITPAQWAAAMPSPLVSELAPVDDEATTPRTDVRSAILERPAEERLELVLDVVRVEVARVAGLEVGDVPTELGLIEVGLDSLMIVELATSLSRQFAVALDPREVFEEPSIAALAATLASSLGTSAPDVAVDERPTADAGGRTIVVAARCSGAGELRSLIDRLAPGRVLVDEQRPLADAVEALTADTTILVVEQGPSDVDDLERIAATIDVRVVHLTRHPFAVVDALVADHGMSQRDAEDHWASVNGDLLDLAEQLDDDRSLLIRFEDLVGDPDVTLGRLAGFAGLPSPSAEVSPPEPELAQRWMATDLAQRPGRGVRRVAEDLGYDAQWPVRPQGGHIVESPASGSPPPAPVTADAGIPVISRDQRIQASPAQERLLFLDEFEPGLALHNLPLALRVVGDLDLPAWEAALTELVRRHESLRTNFEFVDGSYVQLIEPPPPMTVRFEDLRIAVGDGHDGRDDLDGLVAGAVAAEASTPFDLAHDVKLRAVALRLAEDEHVLVLTMHHIASDGWSVLRAVAELIELYGASTRGSAPTLPTLPVQYADYATWQRERLQSPELESQLSYWVEQLAGELPVLDLPSDRPRPSPRSYRADLLRFEIPGELADAVRSHSRSVGATPFMTLLAGYAATLSRWSGQDDVIIGTASANRERPELANLIGLFVNTLALRIGVDGDTPFDELVKDVRRVALDANRNQDVPFDRIVEAVRPRRDVTRSPIYQTMFTLHNMRPVPPRIPGLDVEPLVTETGALDVDLSIELTDAVHARPGGSTPMEGSLRYNADLFDRSTMERLVAHWLQLLGAVVADGELQVGSIGMVTAAERELISRWNATEVELDVAGSRIEDLFAAQVGRTPDAVAVVAGDDTITFGELDRASNRLAHRLRGVGVVPGDIVGVGIPRSVDMVTALLAILKTGAAYLPLDPGFPAQRLAFMVSDADVSVIVTAGTALVDQLATGHDDPQGSGPAEGLTVIDVAADAASIGDEDDTAVEVGELDDVGLAYVIYTSGSTGVPKGVQIEHRNVVNFLCSMRTEPGLRAEDTLLAVTTLSFDISVLEIFLPLTTGARVVIATLDDSTDGARLAQLIDTSGATVMQATPTTWTMLLDAGWEGADDLVVLCGGEAMSRWLADRLLSRCSALWNMFGPTETTIWSTVLPVGPGSGPVSIGRPIANTTCRILDRAGDEQPIGVPGELHIGGAGVARGYLHRPELTAERFVADPFGPPGARHYRTGDLARWRDDGTIEFLGRLDHQVKVRGHRIELGEIETALRNHPDIGEAVVIVREDQPGDQRIVAYVVATEGSAPTTAGLRAAIRSDLPEYMIPSAYVLLDALPLTPNRKIDRNALPDPVLAEQAARAAYVEPRTDLERVVAGVLASLLGVDKVGAIDNFFELGGHSLLATSFAARMRDQFDVELDLRTFFREPTVEGVCAGITDDEVERKRIERIAQIEVQLSSLSPEQVAEMLAERRGRRGSTER